MPMMPKFCASEIDSSLDVAGSAAPAAPGDILERERQRGSQLHAFYRAVIEIEADRPIQIAAASVNGREAVNLPVMEIGRFGIVGLIGRAGKRRRRAQARNDRERPTKIAHLVMQ